MSQISKKKVQEMADQITSGQWQLRKGPPSGEAVLAGLVDQQANPWRDGAQALMDNGEVLGAVIFAGMSQTADMTNTVIANLERERDELRATVDLIREGVSKVFANPWMPQPATVMARLYPYPPLIEQRVKLNKENRETF